MVLEWVGYIGFRGGLVVGCIVVGAALVGAGGAVGGVRKELRKWMNETGIPPEERDRLPLLAAGSEVVWVCGAGVADGLAPTADSEVVLQMEAQKMEEEQ